MTELNQLQPGQPAPDFTLTRSDGTPFSLADLKGRKTIFYFFPVAGTLGCTREANDFNDALPQFAELGYQVVGTSPDSVEKLANFAAENDLAFTLLSDPDIAVHKRFGAWGEKSIIGRLWRGVLRSTVVIDENGTISHTLYGVKATNHVNELLEMLR